MEPFNYQKDIEKIAAALKNKPGVGLILYGGNQIPNCLIDGLASLGIHPLCICDRKAEYLPKDTRIKGLEVFTIEEAKKQYQDFFIFITSERRRYNIIGDLVDNNKVASEQIINYTPVKKKKSCSFIESEITIMSDELTFCCGGFNRNRSPVTRLTENYYEDIDAFFIMREQTLQELEKGIANSCTGCRNLVENYYPVESDKKVKVNTINYANEGLCNFKCAYCHTGKKMGTKLDVVKFINALSDKGQLNSRTAFDLATSGEITIHPNRDKILDMMPSFYYANIFTNALIYNEKISRSLASGQAVLIVSVDAGTKETFAKIKGVDAFEEVCNTLKRYASESENAIMLKYVLMPDINVSEREIDGFITLAKTLSAKQVIISLDFNTPPNINYDEIIRVAKYCYQETLKQNLPCETNSDTIANRISIHNSY